jgi:hypothetical protein
MSAWLINYLKSIGAVMLSSAKGYDTYCPFLGSAASRNGCGFYPARLTRALNGESLSDLVASAKNCFLLVVYICKAN